MSKVRVKYERGVLVPLDKLDLKEGEVLEIEIKENLSKRLSKFVGMVKAKRLENLEELYYEYVSERSSLR
jgi:predicted DNA-binding antitoxin AbrB/MazE fold protein